jgi:hypothetical protein
MDGHRRMCILRQVCQRRLVRKERIILRRPTDLEGMEGYSIHNVWIHEDFDAGIYRSFAILLSIRWIYCVFVLIGIQYGVVDGYPTLLFISYSQYVVLLVFGLP